MVEPRHRRPDTGVDPTPPGPQPDGPRDRGSASSRALRALRRTSGIRATSDSREYIDLQQSMGVAVTSGRRVAVLSLEPGQGATTVAALLAVAFAARRRDPVLLVDAAAPSGNPLDHTFGALPVRVLPDVAARPPRFTTRREVEATLTPLGRDLWLLPGQPDPGWAYRDARVGPDAGVYAAATAPFARWFDITVTDLGYAAGVGTVDLLLARAHALCLVTSASNAALDAALDRLQQFRQDPRAPWAGRTSVVVNRHSPVVGADPGRPARGSARSRPRGRKESAPVIELARDTALAAGFPHRLATLSDETHRAALRLAAQVLDTAVPASEAGR